MHYYIRLFMQSQLKTYYFIIFLSYFLCSGVYANNSTASSTFINNQAPRTLAANHLLQTNNEWKKLLDQSQFERVISTAQAIVKIDANNQDAIYYHALALQLSNRSEQAQPLFANLVDQHQRQANHINLMRLGLSQFYLGDNRAAIDTLGQVAAKQHAPLKAQLYLAYALARNNQLNLAIAAFDKVIAKHQGHSVYYNRGLAHFAANNLAQAAKDMRLTIEQKPDFHQPYYDLITIYVKLSQPKQALMWLNTLLARRETNLAQFRQDPALEQFIQSSGYQNLVKRYELDSEP